MRREDVEDDSRTVQDPDVPAPPVLEIADLARRQLVIEDDQTGALRPRGPPDLFDRSFTDVSRRVRRRSFLDEARDDLGPGSLDEAGQLIEVLFDDGARRSPIRYPDQHG